MDMNKLRFDIRARGLKPLTVEEIIAKTGAKAKYDIAYVLDEPGAPGYASVIVATYETGGDCSASKRRSDRAKALKKIASVDERLAVSLAKASDADIQAALHSMYADGRLRAQKARSAYAYPLSKFVRKTLASGKTILSVATCPRIKSKVIGSAKLVGGCYELCKPSELVSALLESKPERKAPSPYKEHRSLSCGKILAIERRAAR